LFRLLDGVSTIDSHTAQFPTIMLSEQRADSLPNHFMIICD
jgi:hypothetical protein